jgi:hypothetical protein
VVQIKFATEIEPMRSTLRVVYALVPAIGVAAIVALNSPHSRTEEDPTMAEPSCPWHEPVIHGQELENQTKRVMQRSAVKDAVVAEVIAGRTTLFEAAANFRSINASSPRAEHWLTTYQYPDQPYDLALCRSVIGRVERALHSHSPGEGDDIVARLEAELAEHLRRHGRVCLPD